MNAKTNSEVEGSNIEKYTKPKLVYIPLEDENNYKYEHIVKQGNYIYKGDVVAVNKKNNLKMYSTISGYALYGSYKLISSGKRVKCIVIENDYKEKVRKLKKRKNYTKEELIILLSKNKIKLINNYLNSKTKMLIINISDNNYCHKVIINNYVELLLETIDKIIELLEIPTATIIINNKYTSSIKKIKNNIKTYPNIKMKITNNIYIQGTEIKLLKKELNIVNKNIVLSNIKEIYEISELLKGYSQITEKIISIKGNGLNNSKNIKVKIGTLLSEVINYMGGYSNIKNPLLIVGNLINGISLESDDLIITKDLDLIYITEIKQEKSSKCLNCGKCIEICPSKISPISILEGNKSKIEKCTECGLCSYICPSKIEILEIIKKIKEENNNEII